MLHLPLSASTLRSQSLAPHPQDLLRDEEASREGAILNSVSPSPTILPASHLNILTPPVSMSSGFLRRRIDNIQKLHQVLASLTEL